MTPYRQSEAKQQTLTREDRERAMFGLVEHQGEMVPILKRRHRGLLACKKCVGFGTFGNPFCGAIYKCGQCKGTGRRSDEPTRWETFIFWLKGLLGRNR